MGLVGQSGEPASSCCCLLEAREGRWVRGGCWEVEAAWSFGGRIQRGGGVVAGRGRAAEQGGTGAQLAAVPGLAALTEVRAEAAWVAVREGRRSKRAAGRAALSRRPSSQPQESWGHDQTRPVLGGSTARAPPPLTYRNAEEVGVVRIVGRDRPRGASAAGVAATTAAAEKTLPVLRREPLRDCPVRPPPRPPAAYSPIRSEEPIPGSLT